jgi:hypothetical protein
MTAAESEKNEGGRGRDFTLLSPGASTDSVHLGLQRCAARGTGLAAMRLGVFEVFPGGRI